MSNNLIPDRYVLKRSSFSSVIVFIYTIFFFALFVLNILDFFIDIPLITNPTIASAVIFFVFTALGVALFFTSSSPLFKVEVSGDNIKVRNSKGKTTNLSFSDITEAHIVTYQNAQAVRCYCGNTPVFTIPQSMKNYAVFMTNLYIKSIVIVNERRG